MKASTCVVTGANSGVGYATSLALARSGATVVMVCRNAGRGEKAQERIARQAPNANLELALADLASFEQVRRLGGDLVNRHPKIDLLVNNAGVYRARRQHVPEGIEKTFAINHFSHFLLTHLLLPALLGASGRVVNVSSDGHRSAKVRRASLEDRVFGRGSYRGLAAYCDSKLANVLFTRELARRYPATRLCVAALHPGVLGTGIWNQNWDPLSLFMRPFKLLMGRPSVGGDAVAFLAGEPAERIHGRYFEKRREADPAPAACDDALAADLWALSERLTGVQPPSAGQQ